MPINYSKREVRFSRWVHVGLSRGAINHYFKKKEDILVAVLEALDRKLFKLVDDKLKDASHLETEDYMRIRLNVSFELAKDDPAFMYVITDFLSLAMNNPVHKKGIRKFEGYFFCGKINRPACLDF